MTQLWKKYIKYLSVSQLRTLENNPRRWALEKLVGLPTADSPYTQIGREIHDALENPDYYTGKAEHVFKCVNAYMEYLRESKIRPLETELEFHLGISPDLPPMFGYIDVVAETFNGHPLVIDHKTSATGSTFLKVDELHKDIQLLVYALYVWQDKGGPGVFIQHNQYKYRNKKKILNVIRAFVSAEDLVEFRDSLEQRIRKDVLPVIEAYDKGGYMSVPYIANTSRWPCELEAVCEGKISCELYSKIYNSLPKPVYRDQLMDALDREGSPVFEPIDLTKLSTAGIINVDKETNEDIMLKLSDVMAVARDKHKDISNTWDRREAITKSVVDYVNKQGKVSVVLLPGHFLGGAVDPDYMPVVTQLKELKIPVAVEI